MMRLDPPDNREVDYSKTRNNVTNWFDTEYSKYQRLANIPVISSVRLSLAPKGTASANSTEDVKKNYNNNTNRDGLARSLVHPFLNVGKCEYKILY